MVLSVKPAMDVPALRGRPTAYHPSGSRCSSRPNMAWQQAL